MITCIFTASIPPFARSDIVLSASSMADMAGAALSPLTGLLHRELLSRLAVHADEKPSQALDMKKGGKVSSGYPWVYVSGERTSASVVHFDSQTVRGQKYP
ncbi:TPA: transposase [Salmonella enterica subsp. houtenae]|nr:transposase [Salmonella enterica subsp. houtenae]